MGRFADYLQWERWLDERERQARFEEAKSGEQLLRSGQRRRTERQGAGRKKLSYLEAREYETIEQQVADAEEVLQAKRTQLEDPGIVSNSERLIAAHAEMEEAQEKVDTLYARWAELEKKKN